MFLGLIWVVWYGMLTWCILDAVLRKEPCSTLTVFCSHSVRPSRITLNGVEYIVVASTDTTLIVEPIQ